MSGEKKIGFVRKSRDDRFTRRIFNFMDGVRSRMDYSRRELSTQMGIGTSQYSNIKNGISNISIEQLVLACRLMGLEVIIANSKDIMDLGDDALMISKKGGVSPLRACKD